LAYKLADKLAGLLTTLVLAEKFGEKVIWTLRITLAERGRSWVVGNLAQQGTRDLFPVRAPRADPTADFQALQTL
jgi:hypothetical protein